MELSEEERSHVGKVFMAFFWHGHWQWFVKWENIEAEFSLEEEVMWLKTAEDMGRGLPAILPQLHFVGLHQISFFQSE